jgi:hypothetical protein
VCDRLTRPLSCLSIPCQLLPSPARDRSSCCRFARGLDRANPSFSTRTACCRLQLRALLLPRRASAPHFSDARSGPFLQFYCESLQGFLIPVHSPVPHLVFHFIDPERSAPGSHPALMRAHPRDCVPAWPQCMAPGQERILHCLIYLECYVVFVICSNYTVCAGLCKALVVNAYERMGRGRWRGPPAPLASPSDSA